MEHTTDLPGRVLLAEALAMFEVSEQVWRAWKRRGWVPEGERGTGVGRPTVYDRAELEQLLKELGPVPPEREDPEHPGCWLVPLALSATRRKDPRRAALIDAEDMGLIAGRRVGWSPRAGSAEGDGFVSVARAGTTVPLHRLIMGATERGAWVVHLNRDPLDCRRANLEVKDGPKARSRKMGTVNGRVYTSRYKGVSYVKSVGRWRVQLNKDRRKIADAYFEDEIEAAKAYDRAAWGAFGAEAYLNFPEDYGVARSGAEASLARRAA